MEKNLPKTIKLLQISDTHCYASDDSPLEWSDQPIFPNKSLIRVLDHLRTFANDYDALVISGDLAQEEIAATYQRIGEILQSYPLPIFIIPGNHDIPEFMHTELANKDDNIHFQLHQQYGNWHCLFLDTHLDQHSDGHLSPEQLQSLQQHLQNTAEDEHTLIFMHHHPVPIGSAWMDTMGLQQDKAFWEIINNHAGTRAIVCGHIHQELNKTRRLPCKQTVTVYGTPATCVQVKQQQEDLVFDHTRPAWRELDLHANGSIDTQVHYMD